MGADRGEGTLSYLAVLLLVGAVIGALMLSGIGGGISDGIATGVCRVLEGGGIDGKCAEPGGDPGPQETGPDPDAPAHPCLAGFERVYLEETFTIPTRRIDVRTNSRGTIQLNELIGPDGEPIWEVVDFTWQEGGITTPEVGSGPLKGNLWGAVMGTSGTVYSGFRSEQEARQFFEDLESHRIGSDVKFTLRTNPISGGIVWLGTELPWVGDDIDRYMGGSEPDREPTSEYLDGGVTGGIKADLEIGRVKIPLKGRGWEIQGVRTNLENGERTTYYTQRGEYELGVQIDVGDIVQQLPEPLRSRARQGFSDGLDAVMTIIEQRLDQNGLTLLPGQREQVRAAVKLNPSIGLNYKHRSGTVWGITEDENGTVVKVSQVQNGQDILYARADGKAKTDSSEGRAQGSLGGQWILFAQSTLTEKTLDRANLEDRDVVDRFVRDGDNEAVERAWDAGVGTMGRTTYDNTGDTIKYEGKGESGKTKNQWGVEIGRESESHTLQSAHYFKPGIGWVPWESCR